MIRVHPKKPQVFNQKHRPDLALLLTVVAVSLFGLLMVYDASAAQAFQNFADKYYFLRQQFIWNILGFIALGVSIFFDYHLLKKFSVLLFVGSLLLLLLVHVPGLGVSAGGAHRWLKIGSFTLQPTEIIKLTSIIFFAHLFSVKTRLLPFILSLGLISLIIGGLQKDLGSTIVFGLTGLGMYFLSGAPVAYLLGLLPLVGGAMVFLITGSAYRRQRVLAFLDPFADTQGYTYHISQVLIALGSGGFLGLGVGQSRQKFSFIPEVTTDSIFSIIGEELGFLGSLVLILVLGFILFKAFKIASRAEDGFGRLLAGGIVLWLGAQIIVNLGAMVALIPLTGVPLPFISYGGSALLMNLVGIGILLNISKTTRT